MKYFILLILCSVGFTAMAGNPCRTIENSIPIYDKATQTFSGCKLKSISSDSLYAKLGLKEGDIVQPQSGQMKLQHETPETKDQNTSNQ